MKVIRFPLLIFTLFVVLGICLADQLRPSLNTTFLVLCGSCILFGLGYFIAQTKFNLRFLFGLATYQLAFTFGLLLFAVHYPPNFKSHYSNDLHYDQEKSWVEGIITEKLKPNAYSNKYFLKVNSVNGKICSGKLLVILSKKESTSTLQIGDKIVVSSKIKPIIKPHNPYQFDYSRYLEKKDVFDQLYLENNNFKIIGIHKNTAYYLEKSRNSIEEYFKNSGLTEDQLSICKALLIGQKQNINPEITDAYSKSGAIHILAISGLHVGILLFLFKTVLDPLKKFKRGRFITAIILVVLLWLFALLSGLSASVVRAVTMFSFVTIGMYLKRHTNIYNTLGSSIFILLLFEPNYVFDVGFQLSYCAVLAIVTIQPLLSSWYQPKNKIASYFYSIFTVSIAAQLGVLPLSLYYFHQFPGLFFITNLAVIPLVTLILILGIISILAFYIGIPSSLVVQAFGKTISLMNEIVQKIAALDTFIFEDIPSNLAITIASLILILMGVIYFKNPKKSNIKFILMGLIGFQFALYGSIAYHKSQSEFIVFQYPQKTIMGIKENNELVLISPDTMAHTNYIIKNYIRSNFATVKKTLPLKNVYSINRNQILLVDQNGIYSIPQKPDIVILTQTPKINLERLIETLQPQIIIADGSNYLYAVELWKETCRKKSIPFHSTSEKGYFKIKI